MNKNLSSFCIQNEHNVIFVHQLTLFNNNLRARLIKLGLPQFHKILMKGNLII